MMKRVAHNRQAAVTSVNRCREPLNQRLMRGCLIGFWSVVFVVLTSMTAQAQSLEERMDRLEKSMSQVTDDLPKWVKRFQFKGDLRLRYQYQEQTGRTERHRGRVRYRLKLTATVTDQIKTVFGLASGGSDPRSTNQTFQNSFSTKGIQLDLAYAEYEPFEGLTLLGGKFKNPIWKPSDLLWDSDINPEGGALQLDVKVLPQLGLFLTTGVFVIDERSGGADPLLIPIQVGGTYQVAKPVQVKFAFTYYSFVDVQGTELEFSEQFGGIGNTLDGNNALMYDYDSISLSAELGLKNLLGDVIPYIGLIGEFVHNLDPDDDHTGFLAGLKIGHRKVNKGGQWQAKFQFRRLERDAWVDVFPDSDFLGGSTNGEGVEIIINYGLYKNVTIGVDYYHSEQIEGDADQDILQFDIVTKF